MHIALVHGILRELPLVFIGICGFALARSARVRGIVVGALTVIAPFFALLFCVQGKLDGAHQVGGRVVPTIVESFLHICPFWFGWGARPSVHEIIPIVGSSFFTVGRFLLSVRLLLSSSYSFPH